MYLGVWEVFHVYRVQPIVLLVIVQLRKNWGFWKSWCAPISLNFHGVVPEPKKNFVRHKYPRTSLFYRFNQSVHSPTRHLESFWRRKYYFGLSTMDVLVILVRIRIFKSPNSSCLNYYYKNYGFSRVGQIVDIIWNSFNRQNHR